MTKDLKGERNAEPRMVFPQDEEMKALGLHPSS